MSENEKDPPPGPGADPSSSRDPVKNADFRQLNLRIKIHIHGLVLTSPRRDRYAPHQEHRVDIGAALVPVGGAHRPLRTKGMRAC